MLETLASLAQVLGAAAVVAAFVFGWVQVSQFRQQRRDTVAVELMRTLQDSEFARAVRLLSALPQDISAEELRSRGEPYEDAALTLGAKYEALGYLVFRGVIPIELLEELAGGIGVHIWGRLHAWVITLRAEQNQPLFFEWFQWLVEQLEARDRPGATPAFVRHRSWEAPKQDR